VTYTFSLAHMLKNAAYFVLSMVHTSNKYYFCDLQVSKYVNDLYSAEVCMH